MLKYSRFDDLGCGIGQIVVGTACTFDIPCNCYRMMKNHYLTAKLLKSRARAVSKCAALDYTHFFHGDISRAFLPETDPLFDLNLRQAMTGELQITPPIVMAFVNNAADTFDVEKLNETSCQKQLPLNYYIGK